MPLSTINDLTVEGAIMAVVVAASHGTAVVVVAVCHGTVAAVVAAYHGAVKKVVAALWIKTASQTPGMTC
jgi:hypothetical protein